MKKRHLFWIIPCGVILAAVLGCLISFYTSPVKYKKIYRDNKKAKASITEKELKSDLEMMKYYFQYAYSGYDEAVEQGFDVDSAVEEVKKACKENLEKDGTVGSRVVAQKIYEVLNKKLTLEDGHIHVFGQNYSAPTYEYRAFYSDIYLEQKGENFYVYKSDVEAVKAGTKFEGNPASLIEWYDGSRKIWRFGTVSKKNISSLVFAGDGESILVPVAKDEDLSFKNNWLNVRSTKDTVYISISDFRLSSVEDSTNGFSEAFLKNFYEKIRKAMPGKKNVVLDLRNNGGGNGDIPGELLAAILYYNFDETKKNPAVNAIDYQIFSNEFRVNSPATSQLFFEYLREDSKNAKKIKKLRKENPDLEYYDIKEKEEDKKERQRETGLILRTAFRPYYGKFYRYFSYDAAKGTEVVPAKFDGDLYIILNHNSASASEYTVAEASMIEKAGSHFNLHLIGENSAGAVSYFNPVYLFLPASGAAFYMPTAYGYADAFKNDSRYHGEAKGWYPETWTNNKNLLNTLVNLTGDSDLKEELKGLEKNLL